MRRKLARASVIVGIALLACAALALREAAGAAVGAGLDSEFRLNSFRDDLAWIAFYYPMWAALTPLVFWLGRRVPIRRGRWAGPLAFHAVAGIVIATAATVSLTVLFGGLVLGRGWPDPAGLLEPFWTRLALYRAIVESGYYWLILAAGSTLQAYDEYRTARVRAADLERSLTAAQVNVLKMKLQPHFLFNTLNSIAFLALERESAAIATMVERLGSLLRASMQADGRQVVPLDDELALLEHYLAIEEVRFGDRLHVVRRIDPAVGRALVPSLMLQPIIENSIKHGFSQRLDASRLEIAIDRHGDALRVVVSDDGPGLPPGWELATHCGRGLKNVIERLEALYRGAWSFSLRPGASGGTTAELQVPYAEWVPPAAQAGLARWVTARPAAG